MPSDPLSAPELWAKTANIVKDRVNHRSLWETMEKAVGIAIENDTLIIGLNARIFNLAGHLTVSEHNNALEKAMQEITGRRMTLRIIEGETLDDWNYTKKRDERVAKMRTATYERTDREAAVAQSWDSLYEFVARSYSSLHMRQMPQNKARYLVEMIKAISSTMDNLYPDPPDDQSDRHLARIIEKVATNTELPSAIVAFEVERFRASHN